MKYIFLSLLLHTSTFYLFGCYQHQAEKRIKVERKGVSCPTKNDRWIEGDTYYNVKENIFFKCLDVYALKEI